MTRNLNTSRQAVRRRTLLGVVLIAVLALLGAGCGDDGEAGANAAPGGSGSGADGSSFPVTLELSSGSITIDSKPQRVVALGYTDTDVANALGVNLVGAVASPFGDDGVNPYWAVEPLDESIANIDPINPSLEAIAAAKPDIILATTAYPSVLEMYDQLSQIAPVVSPITGILLDSPEDLTRTIGVAVGESEAAEKLIDGANAAIESFREENPQIEGKTVVFAPREGDRTALFVEDSAASTSLLGQLGLTVPADLKELPGDRIFGATFISDEQLDLLDTADIAIVGLYTPDARSAFLALPTVANLDVTRDERLVAIERPLGAALQTPNPVSVHYLLAELGPKLAEAAS